MAQITLWFRQGRIVATSHQLAPFPVSLTAVPVRSDGAIRAPARVGRLRSRVQRTRGNEHDGHRHGQYRTGRSRRAEVGGSLSTTPAEVGGTAGRGTERR